MDPFTAFGLVGIALQLVDCGARFLVLARNLYTSASDANEDYEHISTITHSLEQILPQLQQGTEGEDGKGLNRLLKECSQCATRLVTVLRKVKGDAGPRKRDALRTAFRMMWSKEEIKGLQEHLNDMRTQISLNLLLALRNHVSRSLDQQSACLEKLGVSHDQGLNIGNLAESIVDRLLSKTQSQNYPGVSNPEEQNAIIWRVSKLVRQAERLPDPSSIQISEDGRRYAQEFFLRHLDYIDMNDRQHRIAISHEMTLTWALGDQTVPTSPSLGTQEMSLQRWLESNETLYWITGKPGAGKSTLMKYLSSPDQCYVGAEAEVEPDKLAGGVSQYRCYPHLKIWAHNQPLNIATFYFWNSGQEIQTTQSGLFRTLLHQLLSQRPDIIAELDLRNWETICLTGRQELYTSEQEFRDLLFRTIDILGRDSKSCLFINGLDEFAGDHSQLVTLVQELTRFKKLKICVASRPWNLFQDTLGKAPSLRLEDLSFEDIKAFVQSKLEADAEFKSLHLRYPGFSDRLIENIVTKASGVFLWVDLVVASLLSGMSRGDRVQDLQDRLDELPPDLEALYAKILQSLDPRYLRQAAEYFSLMECSSENPLSLMHFAFADEETLQSALAIQGGTLLEPAISLRIQAMRRRLNSRCKGLLEVDQFSESRSGSYPGFDSVQYLHRTVRDYVKSVEAQLILQASLSSAFDPAYQICIANYFQLRTYIKSPDWPISSAFSIYMLAQLALDGLMCMARLVVSDNHLSLVTLLDDLQRVMQSSIVWERIYRDLSVERFNLATTLGALAHWSMPKSFPGLANIPDNYPSDPPPTSCSELFIRLAVEHGLTYYIKAKQEVLTRIGYGIYGSIRPSYPLLVINLCHGWPQPSKTKCLLELGADPNVRVSSVDSYTPWTFAVTRLSVLYNLQMRTAAPEEYMQQERAWKETLGLLYQYGGHRAPVSDALLTSLSRRLLAEIKDEYPPIKRSTTSGGGGGWFPNWTKG